MYEVLTSPITLLCLGVVFLLISLLFFYFKRSLSLLERAQMEQARVLQSFITNMEMTRQHMTTQQHMPSYNNSHIGGHSDIVHTQSTELNDPNDHLIDVSDDDSDDEDDSDDSDDSGDSDDDIDDDEETTNNENVSAVSINGLSVLEIDELENNEECEIKVVQLQDNHLEEISMELLKVAELSPTVGQQYSMNINISDSRTDTTSDNDSDSDSDSDDENVNESNDTLQNEPSSSIPKIPSVQDLMTSSELKVEHISTDLKTLTLQKLREIAVEKELIQTGSKPNKKDLIKLIEGSIQ